MNTNPTTSWNLDGMRLLLGTARRTSQVAPAVLDVPPTARPEHPSQPFCDELSCGECMLQGS